MTLTSPSPPAVNPFSTRFVRPGALEFLFPPGCDAKTLVHRLESQRWRGAIVGPHGSGKTTLLRALVPELTRAGRPPVVLSLHDGQRRIPATRIKNAYDASTIVIIDGYEQLSRWSRYRLQRHCRRQGCGLLVTAHHEATLPVLFQTATSVDLVQAIVNKLIAEQTAAVEPADVAAAYHRHDGDIRETLFDLYDLIEIHRHGLR